MNIDIDRLRQIPMIGTRRAAAFLSIGLSATDTYSPTSLNLADHSNFQFFPDPAPLALANEAVREFRSWVIGNALKELDASFNAFLDNVWEVLVRSELMKVQRSKPISERAFIAKTNAANKLEIVLLEFDVSLPDAPKLRTMSAARNCLTHSNGAVKPSHTNPADGLLKVKWLGFDAFLEQDGERLAIPTTAYFDMAAPDPTRPAQVLLVAADREKAFSVGESIAFKAGELHEICFWYLRLSELVIGLLVAYLAGKGATIVVAPTEGPQVAPNGRN